MLTAEGTSKLSDFINPSSRESTRRLISSYEILAANDRVPGHLYQGGSSLKEGSI